MATVHEQRISAAIALLEQHTADLIGLLRSLSDVAATARPAEDRWSPAENGWHVALTIGAFADILGGNGPLPIAPGVTQFPEETWSLETPPAVAAPAFLVPPRDATAAQASELIEQAAPRLARAFGILTQEQAQGHVVNLPWGTVSVYQLCDWGGGHTRRHVNQIRQALASR